MSLLREIVKSVAPYAIGDLLDIPIKALDKASQRLDEKSEESNKKLFEKQPGTGILVINQHRFAWKDKFDVYDENREVKYTVKGELASIKHHLHIYDAKGMELGTVKSRGGFGKLKYEVDFNGWHIEGNAFGWNFKIFNGNEEIAHISQKLLHFGDTYVINFSDPKNEFVVLLLVIALDAANATKKSEEIKSTLHYKSGGWL